jgi:MurNAc alpha-1-phosphate uridylyltransferase
MILAAGYGKRMQNLTKTVPKPLLKINNKELLRHNIDYFLSLGCKKIVINTHYLYEQINSFIKEYYIDKNIQLIHEKILLNTGGGIKNALTLLGNKNFVVTNADILWNEENKKDVLNFINNLQDIKTCKLLLAQDINFQGLKKTSGDFKLVNLLIKKWEKNDPHLYYTGLQIINPLIFNLIEEKIFSLNKLWNILINKKNMTGKIINSNVDHIGDINAFNQFKNN